MLGIQFIGFSLLPIFCMILGLELDTLSRIKVEGWLETLVIFGMAVKFIANVVAPLFLGWVGFNLVVSWNILSVALYFMNRGKTRG